MKIRLRYLHEDRDRFGNVRIYVRRRGKKTRIREAPGSEAFMAAYHAALAATAIPPVHKIAAGSFRAICIAYYASTAYRRLDKSTRDWRRRHLDAIALTHGQKPVALMLARHVRDLRDEIADTPGAALTRLKALRALFRWATEAGLAPHDPTFGVKKLAYVEQEIHTCTTAEIEQYKARHPVGTKARLAFDLIRFTTGRREDAVRLGRAHIRDGRVQFRQAKNEHRSPVDIDIPLHLELAASIAATRSGHLTLIVTEWGRPFTPTGFGNAMRDWFDQANLRHCSAHSLRKATPTLMAEAGATPHELMAITGHKTLEEVERYTRKANRRTLADSAMAKYKG